MTLTRRTKAFVAASVIALTLTAAACIWLYEPARTEIRWLVSSRDYKARVLAQPTPPSGELKHVDWDMSGFVGMETAMYLVYDPCRFARGARCRLAKRGSSRAFPAKCPR